MSETARALVQKMVEAGEWPEPALMDEIVAQGQDAVEPLLEIVRSRPQGWPAEAPLDHAITLLCALHPPEALPALVDLLRHYTNDTTEAVAESAAVYGAAAIEPALAIASDAGLGWYSRSAAAQLAMQAAGEDQELRARVAAALREQLALQLAKAPAFTGMEEVEDEEDEDWEEDLDEMKGEQGNAPEDDLEEQLKELEELEDEELDENVPPPGSPDDYFQMTSSLVIDLAALADPQARDLIREAYEAEVVDRWMISEQDVDVYYREGGRKCERPDPHSFLEHYRRNYEAYHSAKRRQPLDLLDTPARSPGDHLQKTPERYQEEPPPKPFVHEERKPGRNDPCWCGSGKKYKHCHMRSDRG